MPAFICCKPGCGNILYPSGPIVTLVSHEEINSNLSLSMNEEGGLDAGSLDLVQQLIGPINEPKNLTLKLEDTLPGSKSHFDVHKFDLELTPQAGTIKAVQSIPLRCNVCGSYCTYQI